MLLSSLLVLVALLLVGLGAYATFTSTASDSQSVTTGTVVIALGATGSSTNRLTVNASGVASGDTIQRSFDLTNQGSLNLTSVTLTTTATTSSLLDTDSTNGLQMVIDSCSVAWTEAGSAPAYTYTCSGTTSSVLASRPAIGSNLALANLGSLTAGATDHLRLTLTLPVSAGNTFQNLTSTLQYSFTGTQRAPTNQ
ncbi:MAG TPA: TasA family protein [Gaiellaceae bacterium]|nr:TasA family protein [Gaiellaceae bacterium]